MKFPNAYACELNQLSERFTARLAWLQYASPDSVYSFLKDHREHHHNNIEESLFDIDEMLLTRNDPLINIALALYSDNEKVCEFIYVNGDERMRKFILDGPSAGTRFYGKWFDTEFERLITERDIESVSIVLKSKYAKDSFIRDFLLREKDFKILNDDDWFLMLIWLSSNDRFKKYAPSYPEEPYDHESMLHAAWALFEIVDPRKLNGLNRNRAISAIASFGGNLRMAMLSSPFGNTSAGPRFSRDSVLKKWREIQNRLGNKENDWYFEIIIDVLEWTKKVSDSNKFLEEYHDYLRTIQNDDDK